MTFDLLSSIIIDDVKIMVDSSSSRFLVEFLYIMKVHFDLLILRTIGEAFRGLSEQIPEH